MKNHKPPTPVSTPAPLARAGDADPGRERRSPSRAPPDPGEPAGARRRPASPVTTRYITLNEIDAEEVDWFLNLNGVRFDEGR